MSATIQSQIRQYVVATWLCGDERGLTDGTDLHAAGLLDSLTTLALISYLETAFGIQIDPADIHAETFRTLDAIAALVRRKSSAP